MRPIAAEDAPASTKARNIATTVLQQHPDLCGITGFWDVMDIGTAAAIKESGKDVFLLTQGGGNRMACDNLANGTFSEVVVYHVPTQARDMAVMIQHLLQQDSPAGTTKTTLFTPLVFLNKDNMTEASCWDLPS